VLYAQYWQQKMKDKPIDFPSKLCPAIADITDGFSFAYLQELFIASLLQIARGDTGSSDDDKGDDDLDTYQLWRVIKKQAVILRKDMGTGDGNASAELVPSYNEAEPHTKADEEGPFRLTRGSTSNSVGKAPHAIIDERPRNMQSIVGRRLTSQETLESLQKEGMGGAKMWDWSPSSSAYL
jgi:hypothetical protein